MTIIKMKMFGIVKAESEDNNRSRRVDHGLGNQADQLHKWNEGASPTVLPLAADNINIIMDLITKKDVLKNHFDVTMDGQRTDTFPERPRVHNLNHVPDSDIEVM